MKFWRRFLTTIAISLWAVFGMFWVFDRALDRREPPPLTCVESRQQFDALRMCMQTGEATGCKMRIEDFARHAELETRLKTCE